MSLCFFLFGVFLLLLMIALALVVVVVVVAGGGGFVVSAMGFLRSKLHLAV